MSENEIEQESLLVFPSGEDFLANRELSDRLYAYALMYGGYLNTGLFSNSFTDRGLYKKLDISYRLMKKQLYNMVEYNYFKKNGSEYLLDINPSGYVRYVSREILEILYEQNMEELIKTYIYLSSLYSVYKNKAWFSYNTIATALGYKAQRCMSNKNKMKELVDRLVELGMVQYKNNSNSSNFKISFVLTYVRMK